MNLQQQNAGVDAGVLKTASYDILRYLEYIEKSIAFLKNDQLPIKVIKRKENGETRYSPQRADNRKEKKAIEVLFNENTRKIYVGRDFNREQAISISDKSEDENYFTLEKDIEGDLIYLQPDLNQLKQQANALKNLRDKPLKEHLPLVGLFGSPDKSFWNQTWEYKKEDWQILTDEGRSGTREQREFVSKALQTKDFALLEGPPGSGKTTAIIELILQFTKQGKRVLLCSATHAAIDNVFERIDGKYKEQCRDEIIPVRISWSEKSVKENVRPMLLQKICNTYREGIYQNLSKLKSLRPSQQFIKDNIRVENIGRKQGIKYAPDVIDQILLDSANLVGGTMIGILQHPDIKANKQGASFDVLIVDEASKVTFPDFIVPALHAKKWILVGDVKQLSPYVEDDYVAENISRMLDAKEQSKILSQYELKRALDNDRYHEALKIYFTTGDVEKEYRELSARYRNLHFKAIANGIEDADVAEINATDVLICRDNTEIRKQIAKNIFVKAVVINATFHTEPAFAYRQNYIHPKGLPELTATDRQWGDLLAGKLSQSFSFRDAEGFENIDREVDYLVPEVILGKVAQLKRLVFPSILEMLQRGTGKRKEFDAGRIITEGFSYKHKLSRFTSLTYQHRMHPDIAKTSKENFYHNDNLKPANTVLANRGWRYALNEPEVKWVRDSYDCKGRKDNLIVNPTEANNMIKDLQKFMTWARDNPKKDGAPYEVAVLTFYLRQEFELRTAIRRITGQNCSAQFRKNNVNIFLYTVDKFQGQEADLVLLGFTKFSGEAFYNSPNRLNVALTRARHKLVLFGNQPWFEKHARLKALRDLATNFKSSIRY